jgi:hypothetical protein
VLTADHPCTQVPIHSERPDEHCDEAGRAVPDLHQPGPELRAKDQEAGRPVPALPEEVAAQHRAHLLPRAPPPVHRERADYGVGAHASQRADTGGGHAAQVSSARK